MSKETIRMFAKNIASSYVGIQKEGPDKGKVRDWKFLKTMYDEAMEKPPNWEVMRKDGRTNLDAIQDGQWLRKDGVPGGTFEGGRGLAWCGIFATYVLRGTGIPVKWREGIGITPLAPYLELCNYTKADEIEPGDICVRGTNQHHFIVYDRFGDILFTYDGNLKNQAIGEGRYNIPDMVKEAKAAEVKMASNLSLASDIRSLTQLNLRPHFLSIAKYNFYFYRLRKN